MAKPNTLELGQGLPTWSRDCLSWCNASGLWTVWCSPWSGAALFAWRSGHGVSAAWQVPLQTLAKQNHKQRGASIELFWQKDFTYHNMIRVCQNMKHHCEQEAGLGRPGLTLGLRFLLFFAFPKSHSRHPWAAQPRMCLSRLAWSLTTPGSSKNLGNAEGWTLTPVNLLNSKNYYGYNNRTFIFLAISNNHKCTDKQVLKNVPMKSTSRLLSKAT